MEIKDGDISLEPINEVDGPASILLKTELGVIEATSPSGKFEEKKTSMEEAGEFLKIVFHKPSLDKILYGKGELDRTWVSLKRGRAAKFFVDGDGNLTPEKKGNKPSAELFSYLGEKNKDFLTSNDQRKDENN